MKIKNLKKYIRPTGYYIIIIVLLFFILLGINIYNYMKPYNIYVRALEKTNNENIMYIKNKITSTGDINGLENQSLEYKINKKDNIMEIKKNLLGLEGSNDIYIHGEKIYLKYKDKYVNFVDSDFMNKIFSNLKVKGNTSYENYEKQIREKIDKNHITKETIVKNINDMDLELKLYTMTINKNDAKKIISSYIKESFNNNLDELIDETVSTQIELSKLSQKEYTEDEISLLKKELKNTLLTTLNNKIDNMDYSDIILKVGIDNNGYIKYREENYNLTIEGKINNIKNVTEYLDFGKNVVFEDINDSNIISKEEYLKQQTNEQKKEIKDYALQNPEEDISLSNVKENKIKNNIPNNTSK